MHGAPSELAQTARIPGEAEALDAFGAALGRVLAGATVDDALASLATATALATASEACVIRAAAGASLKVRAVHSSSAALAAELEGSVVPLAEAPSGEVELSPDAVNGGRLPGAVTRAAVRTRARAVLLLPAGPEEPASMLELYRAGTGFSGSQRSLARLAALHVRIALLLDEATASPGAAEGVLTSALELAGEALVGGSDEAEAAEVVARVAAEATAARAAIVWRTEVDATPAFLAAYGFDGAPPDLEALAELVARDMADRHVHGAEQADETPDWHGAAVTLALGEPPAAALQLLFESQAPGADELERLSGFAARSGIALRRARRVQLASLALERSQTLVAVVSQAIAQLSLSHTLETAVERISELTATGHVAVYLREGDQLVAAASRGFGETPHTELAERLLELALGPFRGRGLLFIEDVRADSRLADLEAVLAETGVRRALVVPLVVGEEVIGALGVFRTRPRPYREGEEGLLIALSSQLAVAVQNARLHERAKELGTELERTLEAERQAARRLRGLFEISHSFTESLSLEATLEAVAKTMVELFDIDAAAIHMPDARGAELEVRAVHVADPALHDAARMVLGQPQPIAAPLARGLFRSGAPVLLGTAAAEGSHAHRLLAPFLAKGSTAAVLPMATPGEVLGTLTLLSLDPARTLDREAVDVAMTVTGQAALAIDNARLYQQQKAFSETMQRSLLPEEPPAVPGLVVGHVYESSADVEVGGDVYDFLALEDGRLAVVLGDVTGKGIQAAADMAMAKFIFRALARSHPEPAVFLAGVNDVVVEEIALGKFITMLYVLVDPVRRELAYASAGHPPLRVVSADGTVSAGSAHGLALGIDPDQTYDEERVTLEPGAAVVLYTDGVIEARRDGELYGEARLDALLAACAHLPAQPLVEAILADCRAFSGGDLTDDCAIVALRLAE